MAHARRAFERRSDTAIILSNPIIASFFVCVDVAAISVARDEDPGMRMSMIFQQGLVPSDPFITPVERGSLRRAPFETLLDFLIW